MRRARPIGALACLLLLGACIDMNKPLFGGDEDDAGWQGASACVPSAEVTPCTQEYRPVCARRQNGEHRTYSNACEACLDPSVVDHRPGSCKMTSR